MKTTMKKQSPLKFDAIVSASLATKEGKASYEASRAKRTAATKGTTKPVEGKPSSKPAAPRGPLARAKAKAETSAKAPTMQMKKSGMKKKC
jgi:hypothetical protein